MGRKTKFDSGIYSIEERDATAESIKNKIGKELLTPEEITIYLSGYGNNR